MDASIDGRADKTDMNDKSNMYDASSSKDNMTGTGNQDEGEDDDKGDTPHSVEEIKIACKCDEIKCQ